MNFQSKQTMPRFFIVALVLGLAGFCAILRAVYTMTIDRERWVGMKEILVKQGRVLKAKRGQILASDGRVLAASLPEYSIYIDYMSVEKDSAQRAKDQDRRDSILRISVDTICLEMKRLFPDIIPEKLKEHLLEGRKQKARNWPVYVDGVTTLKLKKRENKRITYLEYSQLKDLPLFNLRSSTNFESVNLRKRPYGDLARRFIGDFRDTARYGLELTYDSVLAGIPGSYHYEKVLDKRLTVIDRPAVDGCDIQTTLDIDMQEICEDALRAQIEKDQSALGLCVLMEVATGDVKSMVGLSRHSDGSYHEDLALAVTELYEPGSVFKPQSFLVALDEGKIKLTDGVDTGNGIYMYGRVPMKDHNHANGGYGYLSVPMIIAKSSNVGVSRLIYNAYHDDPRKFVDGLYRIGSAEDLKVPLPGYKKPRIRRPGEGQYWSSTTLPWMSIGYETQVTPINTVTFYNGLANNGRLLRPRFVKAIMKDGKVVEECPVEVLREQMARPEAIRDIRTCLEVVTTVKGVGHAAGSKKFPTAGKTGSAQVWGKHGKTGELFVTFVGYFPADKPLYSCIVCFRKRGGGGGLNCAPVFRNIAETIMARDSLRDIALVKENLPPSTNKMHYHGDLSTAGRLFHTVGIPAASLPQDQTVLAWGQLEEHEGVIDVSYDETKGNHVPDVKGYGLRDATYRLEQLGLRVKTKGVGKVTSQSLPAGHECKPGEVIELVLAVDKPRKNRYVPAEPAQPADVTPGPHHDNPTAASAEPEVKPAQDKKKEKTQVPASSAKKKESKPVPDSGKKKKP